MKKQGVSISGFRKYVHLRLTIIAGLLAIAAFGSSVLLIRPPVAHAQTSLVISGETVVYDHNATVSKNLQGWNDDQLGCMAAGGGNITCFGSNGGAGYELNATTKTSGTTTDPANSVGYYALYITNLPGGTFNYANVGPVYKDPTSGTVIGFVHLERWPGGNGGLFWASIGLAYSKDNGTTWTWGGEIIQHTIAYNGTNPSSGYESGNGAYILYTDGGTQYFYVYSDDAHSNGSGGISVSRAPVQQVLNAVNNGTALPTFYKYLNNGWSSQAAWVNGTSGTPQGGDFTDVTGNRALDSIIWDGALNQYVMGERGYDQGYWTVDLITSANPLDFKPEDGATFYEITSPTQAVYPTFVGDPNNPELQANSDGSFYVYYTTWTASHSLNYSDTGYGRRLISVNSNASNSYTASAGFSGTQGTNQWSYQQSSNGEQSLQNMSWDSGNNRWQGAEQYCLIGSNWQHPGNSSCDSIRVWTAPLSEAVVIGSNGPITVSASCGGNTSGVNIRILKNGTQIWPASGWQNVANGASFTFPAGVTASVSPGDRLQFVVSHAGSVNYCDTTNWDQTVSLNTAALASTGFSSTQGANQWSYEQSSNGEQSLQNMSWDSGNNRWQGAEQYCLISSNAQHPGNNTCDSVRVWTAASSGTALVGSNGPITVSASCGGNTSGVNIRILKNGTQFWPSSGWQNIANGGSYSFPGGVSTSVNSGDQIQFVVSHAGSVNYCDTTGWDQSISLS